MAWLALLSSFILGCCGFMVMDVLYQRLRLGNTMRKVKNEMEKLIISRDLVLKKIGVNEDGLEWLGEVAKLEREKIKKETESSSSLSTKQKHVQYDEIEAKAEALNTQYHEFEPFGNIEWFTSTREAFQLLLAALHDKSNYTVGLHGKQGIGKTKLVKFVRDYNRKFLKNFDRVVLATVPQCPDVNKIQIKIAQGLNLESSGCCQCQSYRIFRELQSKKATLVILDNVLAELKLSHIGIPSASKKDKVLLTTRSLQVCRLMECEEHIPLNPLNEEEAWIWFKKHARIDDESPSNILNVAEKVAAECNGIPQTIKQVASSLIKKPIKVWEASLKNLRHFNSTARYHIFLSFYGKDTRYSFTSHLHYALCREGFKVFMDKEGLQSGDRISQSLIEAIQLSRLSIVVFSENYAKSTWCLDELVTILECMMTRNLIVWPIFYKVEPSDVRHQKNSYSEAMNAHKNMFGDYSYKVRKWKSALFEIANLSGMEHKTGYESEFIEKIVKSVENCKDQLWLESTELMMGDFSFSSVCVNSSWLEGRSLILPMKP